MVIKVLKVVIKARVAQGVRLKYKVKHGGEMKGETRDIVRRKIKKGGAKRAERNRRYVCALYRFR